MQKFISELKKGNFRIPICVSCGSKAWPPSARCPQCLSRTLLKEVETRGTLIEFSRSYMSGKEMNYGVVEISGIRIVGSFGNAQLKKGMKVRMTKCGIGLDGTAFYFFVPARA